VPRVIEDTLFLQGTSIPPGESILSNTFRVSGAEHITVNVVLKSPAQNVQRTILFTRSVPSGDSTTIPQRTDTIGETGHLWSLVPVHGSLLEVELTNRGSQPAEILYAAIYGVAVV
jgi:hypothetical protein